MRASADPTILHASAVAVEERGLLILGESGSGKSNLALQLIALGADLIADDRVQTAQDPDGGLILSAPAAIAGRIEARHFGLLSLPSRTARAFAVVDLDQVETRRLPEKQSILITGEALPLFSRVESAEFAPILYLYLKSGLLEQ